MKEGRLDARFLMSDVIIEWTQPQSLQIHLHSVGEFEVPPREEQFKGRWALVLLPEEVSDEGLILRRGVLF